MAYLTHGLLAGFAHLGPDAGAHHAAPGAAAWVLAIGLGTALIALAGLRARRQRI